MFTASTKNISTCSYSKISTCSFQSTVPIYRKVSSWFLPSISINFPRNYQSKINAQNSSLLNSIHSALNLPHISSRFSLVMFNLLPGSSGWFIFISLLPKLCTHHTVWRTNGTELRLKPPACSVPWWISGECLLVLFFFLIFKVSCLNYRYCLLKSCMHK